MKTTDGEHGILYSFEENLNDGVWAMRLSNLLLIELLKGFSDFWIERCF